MNPTIPASPRPTRERLVQGVLWRIGKIADLIDATGWQRLDPLYLALRHVQKLRRWPHTHPPRTFNEHVFAYKLANRNNALFTDLADKFAVKAYVAKRIGGDHVIPTLWHGTEPSSIPLGSFHAPYVVKSTHGSGQVIFVRDQAAVDRAAIINTTAQWLQSAFGHPMREYHYAAIPRQIIVEPFIETDGHPPEDYKFFVFNGVVRLIQVDIARFQDHRRTMFDREWKPLDCRYEFPRPAIDPLKPRALAEMIRIAEALAPDVEFVRVDLYDLRNRILFGELTFTPGGGYDKFIPDRYDRIVGDLWSTPATTSG